MQKIHRLISQQTFQCVVKLPLPRNFSLRTRVNYTRVYEIELRYELSRVNIKVERALTLTRDLIHCKPLFYLHGQTHPNITRQWKFALTQVSVLTIGAQLDCIIKMVGARNLLCSKLHCYLLFLCRSRSGHNILSLCLVNIAPRWSAVPDNRGRGEG